MDILKKLNVIQHYYMGTRGVGHTEAVRFGSDTTPCFVVTNTAAWGHLGFPGQAVAITPDQLDKLNGQRLPLVFDNSGLQLLLAQAASEIADLRNRLRAIRDSIPARLK